ncbi:methylated-DNA--[protein]-cysteine S-methyltransferase [Opacimonas viscosa]|uniref:Methylated-DNA--protein-cysteine methyltransferase n=1 Tax=Opacimonas viscosa TaxID=2961944 RepID=A0AA42BL33_9ALTE|nr:methylated-DNA--[protein]-cysteine S-methyltransferase [Opacimonas viscosa]MCP3428423.1 methylated-DNA--[protein]-cysteine S-methyltransferase [Opacimonas viscosa]
MTYLQYMQTELSWLCISANADGLTAVEFCSAPTDSVEAQPNQHTQQACTELAAYFAGSLHEFTVPLAAQGTHFQHSVWSALGTIPFGQTCSYLDIATKINNPKGVRAVGLANGKNPIAIIVPCHRVIGKNGKLTGYASGLDNKSWLLEHEAKYA